MTTLTLSEMESENEKNEKIEIPEYLYICLYENCKIPSEKQINDTLNEIIGDLTITYDTNKNGIVSGILIYFKSVNLNSFNDLMTQIKYSGSYLCFIKFDNSFDYGRYNLYNIITDTKYKDKYSFKPAISPPRLTRSNRIIVSETNPLTREKPRDYGLEDEEFENEIYNWITMLNVNSSLRIISNMTKILEKKTKTNTLHVERLGAAKPN
jgi:hypothetical protein